MNERGGVLVVVLFGVVLALVTAAGLTVWLLGAERLFILALIVTVGLVIAGVIMAVAVLVRQYRKNDAPPVIERHYHHDGTKTIEKVIDSRPIALPQPQAPQLMASAYGIFPEMLRYTYQSGLQAGREAVDAEVREVRDDEWRGEVVR